MSLDFNHLHVHTQYSLLDGLSKDEDLATAAKSYGMDAVALTDHGVMYGAIHFYNVMRSNGLKPIIGMEAYYTTGSRHDKTKEHKTHHQLLLAKNLTGYHNLLKLASLAHLEGFYYKPRVDWEILEKYHEGLIATSSCPQGEVPWLLGKGEVAKAEERLKEYLRIFGDDYYIELQRHDGLENLLKPLNDQLLALSRKYGIPLIATNDVHYVRKDDARAQDALLAIQTRTTLDDQNRFTMIDSPTYYFKSQDEMSDLFSDLPEALSNTRKIVDKVDLIIPTGKMIYPKYPVPEGSTPEEYLRQLVMEKLPDRYPNAGNDILERINYELGVICDKGYASYFLIVQDFINWAKSNGIRIGPGRGSAAGAIVGYILRITSIDPIYHGLQFERFLNPQRPSPPDIDVDIADVGRDRVIEYVTQKYGEDKVAQVITFGTMEAKAAVRDIGRVLGMPYSEPDMISKLIPMGSSLDEALTSVAELTELYKNPKYKELIDLAKRVEGSARHSSVHAAAVIIADAPLTNYTPLQRDTKEGKVTTQYDMYALDLNVKPDAVGLLKMDFLGLRNLTILQNAIRLIQETRGVRVDLSGLALDDKKVFELLSRGETTGIFQMESGGMRRLAKQLKPDVFGDIVALIALYRPGPMALIPEFVKGKLEPDSVKYLHPDLKPILEETYGIAVYQEQVLAIANRLAGYSLGEADILKQYDKRAGGYIARFSPRYGGLMKLARQSGQIRTIYAHTVRDADEFDIVLGTTKTITHKPATKERGALTGVYCVWHMTNGVVDFEYMDKDQVLSIRSRSSATTARTNASIASAIAASCGSTPREGPPSARTGTTSSSSSANRFVRASAKEHEVCSMMSSSRRPPPTSMQRDTTSLVPCAIVTFVEDCPTSRYSVTMWTSSLRRGSPPRSCATGRSSWCPAGSTRCRRGSCSYIEPPMATRWV